MEKGREEKREGGKHREKERRREERKKEGRNKGMKKGDRKQRNEGRKDSIYKRAKSAICEKMENQKHTGVVQNHEYCGLNEKDSL